MSNISKVPTKRHIGDRVWVKSGASFGSSMGQWATIVDSPLNKETEVGEGFPCFLHHDSEDVECNEWGDLSCDDGRPLYHVSECEMFDEVQVENDAD